MKVPDYETAIISSCFVNDPVEQRRIVRLLASELADDKFTEQRRLIYVAILDCFTRGKGIDILTVAEQLGSSLDGVGGMTELRHLVGSLERLGLPGLPSLPNLQAWAQVVDKAGRLRQIGLVAQEYAPLATEYESMLDKVEDIDDFTADFVGKIRQRYGLLKAGYNPIDKHIVDWERDAELQFQGLWTDRIRTGWENWDRRAVGLPKGELVVLCGLPSVGKTQLALQITRNVALMLRRSGESGCVAVNSLEMTGKKLIQRLACAYAEVDSRHLYSGQVAKGGPEYVRLRAEASKLERFPIFIDDSDIVRSSAIELQCSALHAEEGPLRLLVIDFAELVGDPREESEELRVSGVYRRGKSIAKNLNTTVIILSQYNRGVSERTDKMGTNFDIRYSGFAEILAGMIVHIYNPFQLRLMGIDVQPPLEMPVQDNIAYLTVGKNKDAPTNRWRAGWYPKWTLWTDEGGENFGEPEEGDF